MPDERRRLSAVRRPYHRQLTRRSVVQVVGAGGLLMSLPGRLRASIERLSRPVKLGLIADLHQDIIHDAPRRLEAFLDFVRQEQPDAILQLGDFACPTAENREVTDAFGNAHPRALHVLGNHEIDQGHSFDEVARLWGMPGRYYVASISGLQLVILDGNERPPQHGGGYPAHIGPEQLEWLRSELRTLAGPIIVCCHQPLAGPACIDNADEVQRLLAESSDKILMTINGHTHIDHLVRSGSVMNLHINSASYFWVGGKHRHASYAAEVHALHPWIEHTCPYADALFTMLTIDPVSGRIHVTGRQTSWVGKSPAELGADAYHQLVDGEAIAPSIRARSLRRPPTK